MEKSRLRRENSMAVQPLEKLIEEELRYAKEIACAAKIPSTFKCENRSIGPKPAGDTCSSKTSEEITKKKEVTPKESGKESATN